MKQYFIRKTKYSLDKKTVTIGYNEIFITKKTFFKTPIVKLISNNIKSDVYYEILNMSKIKVNFNLDTKKQYKLSIQDGLKTEIFDLDFTDVIIEDKLDLDFDVNYKNGKLFFKLFSNITKDTTITFEGDINKTIIWKPNTDLNVNFVYQILGFKMLNFKINNIEYKKLIIDRDKFPNAIIKTTNGIRIDKVCQYDLMINDTLLKAGETTIKTNSNTFKVMFKDILLFEQTITTKFQPIVTLVNNPLRLKLNQPYYEDVSVVLNDVKYIIPQGKLFIEIPYKKGIRKFTISDVVNANVIKKDYIIIL